MKLRTKLMLGTQLLLLAALAFCILLMVRSSRQALLDDAVSYAVAEQGKLLEELRTYRELNDDQNSVLVQRTILNYALKKLSARADSHTDYVIQTENDTVYNNCGIDVRKILQQDGQKKHGIIFETKEIVNEMEYQVIRYGDKDYCVAGEKLSYNHVDYLAATVRDITQNMNRVRELTVRCVAVGLLIMLCAALLEAFFLYGMLWPIGELERGASLIARGEYGNRIDMRRKDEIGRLAGSFNQMAEAVEAHVDSLEAVAEERKLLLAALAHEMRTPVTAITGYAYALHFGKLSDNQRQEAVVYVDEQSRRLERLSNKLTRLISLEGEIELYELSSGQFFAHLKRTLAPLAEKDRIELSFSADSEVFKADEDLLVSLTANLFDNARKAGADHVKIRLHQGVFTVSDNGCGMEKEELDKIMQPFYKVDRSRNREGFGLGLALCQRIAQMHGTKLQVESTPGEGTSFSLHFFYNSMTTLESGDV